MKIKLAMKVLYDFLYCPDQLTPQVVWYTLRVGRSQADQRAFAFVRAFIAGTSSFFLQRHSLEMAAFKEKISASMFSLVPERCITPVGMLRQATIDVLELAKFLRQFPAAFLNRPILSGACAFSPPCLTKLNVENLSQHDNQRKERRSPIAGN